MRAAADLLSGYVRSAWDRRRPVAGAALPAFADFIGEASAYLAAVSRYSYVQEPVPSAIDHEILQICSALEAAGPARAPQFTALLDDQRKTVLGIFGRRMPELVLARSTADADRQPILTAALVAEALANAGHRDFRDVLVGLVLHHECARRLQLDVTDLFDAAAGYADIDTGALMRIFGRRHDVSLRRFGWREVMTAAGPIFELEG